MAYQVLIVESNPAARQSLTRIVHESFTHQMIVHDVADVNAAHAWMKQKSTDSGTNFSVQLLLVDLDHTDQHGLMLLRAPQFTHCLKVATSLNDDIDVIFGALQSGAQGYLLKENRDEVLIEQLQRIVRGNPPITTPLARRILSFFREHGLLKGPELKAAPVGQEVALANYCLTQPETNVLMHMTKGFTPFEIAATLGVRWSDVQAYSLSIYQKLHGASVSLPAQLSDFMTTSWDSMSWTISAARAASSHSN